MNEDNKSNVCQECNDSGYITWFMGQNSQGFGMAIVPPGVYYPASKLVFEACKCEKGKEFYTIIS